MSSLIYESLFSKHNTTNIRIILSRLATGYTSTIKSLRRDKRSLCIPSFLEEPPANPSSKKINSSVANKHTSVDINRYSYRMSFLDFPLGKLYYYNLQLLHSLLRLFILRGWICWVFLTIPHLTIFSGFTICFFYGSSPRGGDFWSWEAIVVIMPNIQEMREQRWRSYLTNIDAVEKATDHNLSYNLPLDMNNLIKARVDEKR